MKAAMVRILSKRAMTLEKLTMTAQGNLQLAVLLHFSRGTFARHSAKQVLPYFEARCFNEPRQTS